MRPGVSFTLTLGDRHQAMRLPDRPDPRSGTPTAFAIARSVQWVAA